MYADAYTHEIGALAHKISSVEVRNRGAKCRRGFYRVSTFDLIVAILNVPDNNHCPVIIAMDLLRCDIKQAFAIFCFVLFCFSFFILFCFRSFRFVLCFVLVITFVYFVIVFICLFYFF